MPDIMDSMDIAFPNLGIYLRNVPKSFTIGNFTIALYGIMIAIGMLAGIMLASHIAKKTGQDPNLYWDISIWLIIFSLIGARIYYVIFFWDMYKDNLLQIFNLRGGGLAIYGGVIGGVITALVYSRIKKQNPLLLMDTAAYGLILGQIIGRWGNFFNREVFGGYTNNIFAMRLPLDMVRERDITADLASHIVEGTNYIQVHPTFLYEGLWNLGVLILMLLYCNRRRFTGEITLLYFAGYGLGRAWIEYIRTDQLYIPGTEIPVSMVLAIVMVIASVIIDIIARILLRRGKIKPYAAVNTAAGADNAAAEENDTATNNDAAAADAASCSTIEKSAEEAAEETAEEGKTAESTGGAGTRTETEDGAAGEDAVPEADENTETEGAENTETDNAENRQN